MPSLTQNMRRQKLLVFILTLILTPFLYYLIKENSITIQNNIFGYSDFMFSFTLTLPGVVSGGTFCLLRSINILAKLKALTILALSGTGAGAFLFTVYAEIATDIAFESLLLHVSFFFGAALLLIMLALLGFFIALCIFKFFRLTANVLKR